MKFYDHLAEVYDYFIDWDARIKREDPLYQHLLRERLGTSILDLGCGSGGFSIHWAEMGYNVVGLDSSSAMVKQARKTAEEKEIDIEFQCLQMTDFASRIQQQFDAIVCVGNNLSHLLEPEKVKQTFAETIKALKPSGIAVFQILNYHRILEIKRRDFPVKYRKVGDKEYLFIRFYNFLNDWLDFNMVVSIKEKEQWISRSLNLKHRPWTQQELVALAKEAGFTDIMVYGDYQFGEWNPAESDDLLLVCEVNPDFDEAIEIFEE